MPTPDTAAGLLRAALAGDAARPLLTFYDDATGERVELSVATYANWVAKTANLLQDDLDLQRGGTVALLLPLHWQAAVWAMATWAVGASVMLEPSESDLRDADVVVTSPPDLERAMVCGAEVVHLSLRPALLAARVAGPALPASVLDADTEVAGHGDRFVAAHDVEPHDLAVVTPLDGLDATELAAYARQCGARWALEQGGRLLTTLPPTSVVGLCALVVAPLALGASSVLVANADSDALPGKRANERVTAVAD